MNGELHHRISTVANRLGRARRAARAAGARLSRTAGRLVLGQKHERPEFARDLAANDRREAKGGPANVASGSPGEIDHYTCSMHPSVKQAGPGQMPDLRHGL